MDQIASYTMELREYIEMWSQKNIDTMTNKDIIEAGRTKLFDFDYPIFDPAYKSVFETHFIRTFYMREIGFETEGLFKFNLETWLNIHMPYFNLLFESETLKYDPLTNANVTDSSNRKGSGNSNTSNNTKANSNSGNNSFARNLDSNNPDTRLTITSQNGQGVIEYASSIDERTENNQTSSTGTSNQTGTASATSTEDYLATRTGKTGDVSYAKLLTEYRDSLIRVEKKIFQEMQELFMLVY